LSAGTASAAARGAMVFFFEPRGCEAGGEDYSIYMGRDKFENEDLIRYGLPTDLWCAPRKRNSSDSWSRAQAGLIL